MGYQPGTKSPKGAIHEYKKPLREKRRDRKHIPKRVGRPADEKKHVATEREISEVTLKLLHTLGNQKFGSSPFSEHFDRWLTNVGAVLSEFETNPNIGIDDQFVRERSQALATIKRQLENRHLREASLNREIRNLSDSKSQLQKINTEYATAATVLRGRKDSDIRRLNSTIARLKKEQKMVIQMKTGFLHGISTKRREQREIKIAEEISDKQRQLELALLDSKCKEKNLRNDYERIREPFLEEIITFQKRVEDLEEDGSLEERWFACEALIDAVNTFLQRKADRIEN